MGTLRVRTWQLWGAKTADHRCFIIRTSPPRFQIVIFPRFVGNSDVFCFAKPVPARRRRFNRPTQMRTIRGKFVGNLRISPATFQASCARNAPAARRRLRNAAASDHRPRPVRRPPVREQASCKNKARHVRPGSSLVSCAGYDALLHRRDFSELALERLISLPGEVGIKLAQLGRLRHEGLIGALGIVGLHFDRLFE